MSSLCGPSVADSVNVIQHTNVNPTLIQLHVNFLVFHIFESFPVFRYFLTLEVWHLKMTTHHGGRWAKISSWLVLLATRQDWHIDIGQTTFGLLLLAQNWLHNDEPTIFFFERVLMRPAMKAPGPAGPTHACIIISPNIIGWLYKTLHTSGYTLKVKVILFALNKVNHQLFVYLTLFFFGNIY